MQRVLWDYTLFNSANSVAEFLGRMPFYCARESKVIAMQGEFHVFSPKATDVGV